MTEQILLSAHQPAYLPWLGLLHKIAVADSFIIFDMVPYSRKMFYNRNRILSASGPVMLSVPVRFSREKETPHSEVAIDNTTPWRRKHWQSILHAYSKTRYFDDYAGQLEAIYTTEWDRLVDLNEKLLLQLTKFLGITTPFERGSLYKLTGAKSNLVLNMCNHFHANAYLFGALGRNYADIDSFLKAGVTPLFQKYNHPKYTQLQQQSFESNLSVIDLLFNHGPDSYEILMANNMTRADYLAQTS